jgi:hypothetical protein
VRGTSNHSEYVKLLGQGTQERLSVSPAMSQPVNYGRRA